MKAFRILLRSINDGLRSIFRNFSLSTASILCSTITLILVAVAMVLSANVDNFTKKIEDDMTIVVFLDSKATSEEVEIIRNKIDNIANVDEDETIYKTKAEVKMEMQNESAIFNTVMGDWDEETNPLKDTFQLKVKDIEQINETAKEIENIDKVSTVRYGEGLVEKMVGAFKWIERIAYGAVLALILVTIFLIINTIKLTIFSRQREISIMRLVGASNFVIKTPFIIEGMFLGLIGSIIPILVVLFGYTTLYDMTHGYLFSPIIQLIKPTPFIYYTSAILVVIAMIVGMIGSARAARKYLKV